jgi:hypothetical protein
MPRQFSVLADGEIFGDGDNADNFIHRPFSLAKILDYSIQPADGTAEYANQNKKGEVQKNHFQNFAFFILNNLPKRIRQADFYQAFLRQRGEIDSIRIVAQI